MSDKYKDSDHFKARCWENVTFYLDALDKSHITRLIEKSISDKYEDTNKPQGAGEAG
jgi:hypothetical protein